MTVVLPPRVEHHRAALGIGEPAPRLSWRVETAEPGWVQEAYEVEGIDDDGSRWTSGRVGSADSVLVGWPGPALRSRRRVRVRVRVWAAGADGPTGWSGPTPVEAGLLDAGDWAGWFVAVPAAGLPAGDRPPVLLRREFAVGPGLVRARAYATACGLYELELNGERVGEDVLAPGWTSYAHRLTYQTHDVTARLREGANAVGAHLADGWYRGTLAWNRVGERYGPRTAVRVQLELDYADGRREVVATDGRWTWAAGPVLRASLYDGERHDARLERPGWSRPGAPGDWAPVEEVAPPVGELVAPAGPPVRRQEVLAPVSVERLPDGTHLLDFGQNLVGRLRLRVAGPGGTVVGLRHAEVLEDGRLCTRPLRTAAAHDEYVLRGGGTETWEPRFTVHGFRYAEVTGWPGDLGPGDVVAVVCHDDLVRTGWFCCSDPLLERLHENVVWSMKGNFVSVPTDCPQRDERLGWTGDLQVFAPTASFLFDSAGAVADWLRDVAAETGEDGLVPPYVPYVSTPFRLAHYAVWGDAATVVPAVLHERFGDVRPVETGYDTARAWVEGCRRLLDEHDVLSTGAQLGDWLDPAAPPDRPHEARTDPYLVATAYLALSARLLAGQAELVGKQDDAVEYAGLADRVTAGFRREFLTPAGRCAADTQTAYALALRFGLVETPEQRAHAGQRLRHLVRASDLHIGTGFAGTNVVLDALTDAGQLEWAYRLVLERSCPSWLFPVTMGATTVWERWDSLRPDGSVNPGEMTSFNHYAYGSVADWLHRVVAGLAPAAPGYRRLRFAPRPGGGLTAAGARHTTPYGTAEIAWTRTGPRLHVAVSVPPKCAADVVLADAAPVAVGSGRHEFEIPFRAAADDPVGPLGPRPGL